MPPTNSKIPFAVILGISLIISFSIFGGFYYYAQYATSRDVLTVTGSAKKAVTSDQAKLTIVLSRVVPVSQLAYGNSQVSRDLGFLNELLAQKGISATETTISPVSMNQFWSNKQGGENEYELRQTAIIQSADVSKITNLSKAIPELAVKGAIASVQSLEYYYSKLPETRVSLLSDAVKDAKDRADKIAESAGKKTGSIRSASSGVVQVLPLNSVDVSDYGTYDTSSIEKEIMVTVKTSFGLK
ncbi:MAG: SIMPL domain-containing protein [Candidatus Pacebacteria bacterium]|nr:SIMPL domain-containing protein [Candidatus Paceibacterota bacterium]